MAIKITKTYSFTKHNWLEAC